MNEYLKKWKLKNPTYFKEYYEKNKEKLDLYHKDWVEKNKDKFKKYQRNYHKEHYQSNKLKKMEEKVKMFKATLPLVKETLESTLEK